MHGSSRSRRCRTWSEPSRRSTIVQEFDTQGRKNVETMEEAEARAELEAALRVPKPGDIVRGQVVRVSDDSIMVDVGYKSEGIIPLNELSHRPLRSAHDAGLKVGDEVQVVVLSVDTKGEGGLRISKRRADEQLAWAEVERKFEAGEVIEAEVTEAVKGGLVVDLGLRAFLPASQVDRGYVADLSKFVGQKIRVKIIELDPYKGRVILSRKQVLEAERTAARERFWSTVQEGDVLEGTVKSITDFGAFIDLGGVDGLLHISEMSYGRIKHPSQVVSEGERIKVKVLRLDREKGKVSLGLKQVLPDPWDSVEEKYPEGAIVEGTVARLTTFGAFVELEPGVDGLIHISQMADRRINNPGEVVSIGDVVKVKVINVDAQNRRISLSLRAAIEELAAEAIAADVATPYRDVVPAEAGEAPSGAEQQDEPAREAEESGSAEETQSE
ncbi:MAG: 30S ribosomal protein S1 [Symbiobacterium thermophilum]|uniref:30S ribosomal protein S1 n=2 Tax=Symbiobacterium thermophilum TaxID=2734 RepID=Q67NT8_SYMTH|nr:30S ribosomal protein S1 [Symbiobacterium thermophilum]OTA41361.1 MAG: 30S ribosomal protein S1 [Symbiobacterium thermophilum]BAD40655.1 30S ribosomal protein S1 [Symbiobacterium thermophilum IAM 14863]